MKGIVVSAIAFVGVIGLTSCGGTGSSSSPAASSGSGKRVSRADYGKAWPLTVDSGTLSCNGGAVTFTSNEGTVYWINGTAGNEAGEKGWQDIHPIWAKNPDPYSGPKKSIGPLIDDGLAICG